MQKEKGIRGSRHREGDTSKMTSIQERYGRREDQGCSHCAYLKEGETDMVSRLTAACGPCIGGKEDMWTPIGITTLKDEQNL